MPKVYCYLNQKTIDQLEQIKQTEEYESSSQVMKEMIALGIRVYLMNKEEPSISEEEKNKLEKEEELQKQHSKYLLRLLSLNADILRCIFDKDKIPESPNTVEDLIRSTKDKVDLYIEDFIKS